MRNRGRRHCAEKASQRINQYYNIAIPKPIRITRTTRAASSHGISLRQRRPSPNSRTIHASTSATPIKKETAALPYKQPGTVSILPCHSPQQPSRKRLRKVATAQDSSRKAINAVTKPPRDNPVPTPTPAAASAAKVLTASDPHLPKIDKRQQKGSRVFKDSPESHRVKELLKKVLQLRAYKNVGVQTSPPKKRTAAPPPPPTMKQEPLDEEESTGDSKIPFRLAQVKVEPKEEPIDQADEEEDLKPLAIIRRDDNYEPKRSGLGPSSDDVTCEVQ